MTVQNLATEIESLREELERLDTELEELDTFFETLFEKNPNGVAVSDANAVVRSNSVGAELFGSQKEEQTEGADGWSKTFGIYLPDRVTLYRCPQPSSSEMNWIACPSGSHSPVS